MKNFRCPHLNKVIIVDIQQTMCNQIVPLCSAFNAQLTKSLQQLRFPNKGVIMQHCQPLPTFRQERVNN